jgi:hypothetical protein
VANSRQIFIQNRSLPAIGNPPQSALTISVTGGTLTPVPSSQSIVTDFDATYTQFLTGGTTRGLYIATTNTNVAQFSSINTGIATVSAFGSTSVISRAGNGVGNIRVTGNLITKIISVDMTQTNQTTTNSYISAVSGTLAAHLCDQIDSRIAGKNPLNSQFMPVTAVSGTSLCRFSDPNYWQRWPAQIPEPQTYTHNPGLWCSGVDLSFWSPWNSNGGTNYAGCLITPRHIVLANHWSFPLGTTIHFVDMQNNIYKRSATGKATATGDIAIYTLNADISAGCRPVKLFPQVYSFTTSSTPGLSALKNYLMIKPPLVVTTQDKNCYIAENNGVTAGIQPSVVPSRAPFFYGVRGGDSSSPGFFIVNGEASLNFVAFGAGGSSTYNPSWYASVGGGAFFGARINTLNNTISAADANAGLASGYANSAIWPVSAGRYIVQLTDVSMFPVLS